MIEMKQQFALNFIKIGFKTVSMGDGIGGGEQIDTIRSIFGIRLGIKVLGFTFGLLKLFNGRAN